MAHNRIGKVLIANRGEIALRIQRTCERLGIPTVTTVSDVDKDALFSRKAQKVASLPGSSAKETYLNGDLIISLAKEHGCNAIHPGYGFLSENSLFAASVKKAGLIFIGPEAETIALLGNKVEARKVLLQNNVPCTPGSGISEKDEELVEAANSIGYPVIIKAALGGGGRGMRVAQNEAQIVQELPRARSEALKFFGDGRIYLEKLIEKPRHIEVQLLGDKHGSVIHLGTRECSAQRRSQKLVEEAPAPNLTPKLRDGLHDAAVKAAKAAKYDSVGTAEFLVKDGKFYFLEMNTRIQVEHPVTEEVCGVDLIELQLKVANGERLPLKQEQITFNGHAIEFRINAEDCREQFRPATGRIGAIKKPTSLPIFKEYLREEQGFESGDSISPYYDGLITKLIVKGESRAQAVQNARLLLRDFKIESLPTTLEFHRWLLLQPEFLESRIDIGFVERTFSADCIKELEAREVVDPHYSPPIDGVEKIEFYEHHSERFDFLYSIKLVHCVDRSFLAIPQNKVGKLAKEEFCRRSNGMKLAITSLVSEVLEKSKPEEIFR